MVESVSMGADVLRGVAWWKQRGGGVADGARWQFAAVEVAQA